MTLVNVSYKFRIYDIHIYDVLLYVCKDTNIEKLNKSLLILGGEYHGHNYDVHTEFVFEFNGLQTWRVNEDWVENYKCLKN